MSSGGHPLDIGMAIIDVAVVADDGSAGGIAAAVSAAGVDRKDTTAQIALVTRRR